MKVYEAKFQFFSLFQWITVCITEKERLDHRLELDLDTESFYGDRLLQGTCVADQSVAQVP